METSADSLEGTGGGRHDWSGDECVGYMQTLAPVSKETDIYGSEERDSLDEAISGSPFHSTMTTLETTQTRSDGSSETITRRVISRVVDPVHSRVVYWS